MSEGKFGYAFDQARDRLLKCAETLRGKFLSYSSKSSRDRREGQGEQ